MNKQELEKYAAESLDEAIALTKAIAVIPAPSHHEEKRAKFIMEWLDKNGIKGAFIDEALNVEIPFCMDDKNPITVIMAHTDIVFPEETQLEVTENDGKLFCPGIGDDTLRLAILLISMRYFVKSGLKPKTGILFVANSCEEGLGNLKGSRKIVDTYGDRIKEFITFDGNHGRTVTRAVGSHRYKIEILTEGGHSFGAFGNRNAIHYMASLISTLYDIKVPANGDSKTTYNVGNISGGRTVNTIAQECTALYEYRSDDIVCLQKMKEMFEKVIDAYKSMGITVNVELLGERPCMGDIDPERFRALKDKIKRAYEAEGIPCFEGSSSTDANYPMSKGIPAVCAGLGQSFNSHRLDEYTVIDQIKPGIACCLNIFSEYFE